MRLDLLIQSFLRGTKKLQRSLSENLDTLEACTSLIKSKAAALAILDQYDKADHLVTVVEILGKLNDEILVYQSRLKRKQDGKKLSKAAVSKKLSRLQHAVRTVIESNSPDDWEGFIDSTPSPPLTSNLATRKVQNSPYPRTVKLLMPPTDISTVLQKASNDIPQLHSDKSDRYWSDEHHKFLKFPDKDWYMIIQENNLSYQNLHLVAPANFVTPTSPEYIAGASLPWLTEQDVSKENFDILREDLERVLTRTRALQDRVWRAAELSVKLTGPKTHDFREKRFSVSWQTRDSVRGYSRESGRSELSAMQLSPRSWTSASLPLAGNVQWKDERSNRDCDRITRVNIYQNYPQMSNRWSTAMPNPFRCLAQTSVANQGNLIHQTKLRLYIPETERKKCDVKRDLITPDSIFSAQSFRGAPSSMRFINKLKSRGDGGITRLHKERINFLVNVGLKSVIDTDRSHAAVSLFHLGALDLSSAVPALIGVVNTDSNSLVKFQAAKALLNMGVCNENALRVFIACLLNGSSESQTDLLECISCVPDVKSLFYECGNENLHQTFIRILQEKSETLGEDERLAFLSAMCLVDLCDVTDDQSTDRARKTLKSIALFSDDKNSRAQALEALTKSLDSCDADVFDEILNDMKNATIWRHRLSAALLLAYLGPDRVQQWISEEEMYEIIRLKVWDDPKREVRLGISQSATALGMRPRLLDDFDRYLRDPDEELRSRAVIAMSAVGIHSDATLRYLNEMLDLDESDYVRLQIIKTYRELNLTDIRAIRAVRERERAGGALGRAAQKLLTQYGSKIATPKSGRRLRKMSPMFRRREVPDSRNSLQHWTANNTKVTPRKAKTLRMSQTEKQDPLSDENDEMKRLTMTSTAVRKSVLKPGTRLPVPGASGTIIRA